MIGGWLPGEGGRAGRLGALLVGFHQDGELRYAGRVGTGYSDAELARLAALLEPLARPASPFSGRRPPKLARYVEPELVCVVEYSELTNAHAAPPVLQRASRRRRACRRRASRRARRLSAGPVCAAAGGGRYLT